VMNRVLAAPVRRAAVGPGDDRRRGRADGHGGVLPAARVATRVDDDCVA
jgi:hypothetical protein